MIPLMFIQKSEKLLKETTATIHSIKAKYLHSKHALELDFKINLDAHFSLMLELNEFDMPRYTYIKTLRKSEYQLVDPSKKDYTIEGDTVVFKLTYDDIIAIAKNKLTSSDMEKWDIKAKMLNPDKDPNILMQEFSFSKENNDIRFIINNKRFIYMADELEPILITDSKGTINASKIVGNYFIFPIELDSQEYQLAILHFNAFKNHYLFRQSEITHHLKIDGDNLIDGFERELYFFEGMVSVDNDNWSVQKFLDSQYNEEYKQYLFNALRDKNLYTEISNAFNIVKHNSVMIYDYKNNERLMGSVKVSVGYNKKTTPEIVMRVTNICDQFHKKKGTTLEFRIPLYNMYNLYHNTGFNYRLIDYGYFILNSEYEPVSTNLVNTELDGYVTASNDRYLFSISTYLIESILEKTTSSVIPILKELDEGVFISNRYNVAYIDFESNILTLNNAFTMKEIKFEEIPVSDDVLALKSSFFFLDTIESIFGLKLKAPLKSIEFDGISADMFYQVLLTIKTTESDDYLLEDISRDTHELQKSIIVRIANREIAIIYNSVKDRIYYIDLNNQDASLDIEEVKSISAYLSLESEERLKSVLDKNCIREFVVKNNGYAAKVDSELNVIPYMAYSTILKPLFSSRLGLKRPIGINEGYFVRNAKIKGMYRASDEVYKEVLRGVFLNSEAEFISAKIVEDALEVTIKAFEKEDTYRIKVGENGKFVCYDLFSNKKELPFNKKIFNESYGVISFSGYLALDMNIVKHYIENRDFVINLEVFVNFDDTSYFVATSNVITEIDRSFFEVSYDEGNSYAVLENWLSNELFGIIKPKNLSLDDRDMYVKVSKYSDKNKKIVKIDKDLSKYIVKP